MQFPKQSLKSCEERMMHFSSTKIFFWRRHFVFHILSIRNKIFHLLLLNPSFFALHPAVNRAQQAQPQTNDTRKILRRPKSFSRYIQERGGRDSPNMLVFKHLIRKATFAMRHFLTLKMSILVEFRTIHNQSVRARLITSKGGRPRTSNPPFPATKRKGLPLLLDDQVFVPPPSSSDCPSR